MPSSKANIALIVAAGRSTRMGTCKATLPWLEGKSLLTYQVEQWLLANVLPTVVLGPHNAALQSTLPTNCQVVVNPHPARGKASSILVGLRSLPPQWEVLAIAAVDQPRPAWIYQALLQQHFQQSLPQSKSITAPIYQGRMGHPILFSQELLPHLNTIREDSLGLRRVMQFESAIHRVEFDAAIVLADLNTPELYQRWLQL